MFQTEPILYLQALASGWLTCLMVLISSMGTMPFFAGIIILITFGVDFRKGFLLFQLLLWTGISAEILKGIFALPRPDYVDSRVLNIEKGRPNMSLFNGKGAKSFFGLPARDVLDQFRLSKDYSFAAYGFPSGHVSATTAFWGGAFRVFKNQNILRLAPLLVALVAFSRMYLGRHFLGDVIGGALLGLVLAAAFSRFLRSPLCIQLFEKESYEPVLRSPNILFYTWMFIAPFLLWAVSLISADVSGFLMGTNTAFLLIMRAGVPENTGTLEIKAARVLLALGVFFAATWILNAWAGLAGISTGSGMAEFLKTYLSACTVWVSVATCYRLGLYKRKPALTKESQVQK